MEDPTFAPLTDKQLDDLQEIAPRLQLELRDVQVCCINSPPDYPKADNVAAFTPASAMDWALFEEVDRRCGWRGDDGVVIAFNRVSSSTDALAVLIHELAHVTR